MLTEKQKKIVTYLQSHDTIDFKTVRELIDDHYRNGDKHCSDAMTRMVRRGIVVRIKKGLFKLGNPNKAERNYPVDPNQSNLFNE